MRTRQRAEDCGLVLGFGARCLVPARSPARCVESHQHDVDERRADQGQFCDEDIGLDVVDRLDRKQHQSADDGEAKAGRRDGHAYFGQYRQWGPLQEAHQPEI